MVAMAISELEVCSWTECVIGVLLKYVGQLFSLTAMRTSFINQSSVPSSMNKIVHVSRANS